MNNSGKTASIAYSKVPESIDAFKWNELMRKVPKDTQNKVFKYGRIQDRYRFLLGRLLLKHVIETYLDLKQTDILDRIEFTETGRPFCYDCIDFNISHSGDIVICAAVESGKVGIDIEWIRPIEVDEYKRVLTSNQVKLIKESSNPLKMFFRIWTMKESVTKVIGRGLQMSLNEIDSDFKTFDYYTTTYYLHEVFVDPEYCCFVATDRKDFNYSLQQLIL